MYIYSRLDAASSAFRCIHCIILTRARAQVSTEVEIKYSLVNKRRPSIPWRHQLATLISTSAGRIPRDFAVSHARGRAADRLTVGILLPATSTTVAGRRALTKTVVSASFVRRSTNPSARRGDVVQLSTRPTDTVDLTHSFCASSTSLACRRVFLSARIATRLTQRARSSACCRAQSN